MKSEVEEMRTSRKQKLENIGAWIPQPSNYYGDDRVPPLQLPAQIMMDDPCIVTTSFASKYDCLVDVTDIKQIPVCMKWENFKREAESELEMGCVLESNMQYREPTLQDSDELISIHNKEDAVCILPSINADDVISALPQKSYNTTFIDIQALPSDKEKNPPYLVKGKAITTNILTPVKFWISGVKAMQKICVSMRYTDELHKNTAVKPCKLHQDWNQRSETLPADFNFYITTECTSYETTKSSHPTAIIDIQEGFIDGDEDFTFSVVFVCLNSCHRLHGKKMELGIAVYDHTGTSLLKKEHYTIHACRNVKRDHKGNTRYPIKRRYCTVEKDCEEFQMKSKDDEDIILTMIDRLKGVSWCP